MQRKLIDLFAILSYYSRVPVPIAYWVNFVCLDPDPGAKSADHAQAVNINLIPEIQSKLYNFMQRCGSGSAWICIHFSLLDLDSQFECRSTALILSNTDIIPRCHSWWACGRLLTRDNYKTGTCFSFRMKPHESFYNLTQDVEKQRELNRGLLT